MSISVLSDTRYEAKPSTFMPDKTGTANVLNCFKNDRPSISSLAK